MIRKIIAWITFAVSMFGITLNYTGTNSLAIFTLPTAQVRSYEAE